MTPPLQSIGAPLLEVSNLLMNIQHRLVWFPCSPKDSQESSLAPQFKSISLPQRCQAPKPENLPGSRVRPARGQMMKWSMCTIGTSRLPTVGYFHPLPTGASPGKGKPALKKDSDMSHCGSSVQQLQDLWASRVAYIRRWTWDNRGLWWADIQSAHWVQKIEECERVTGRTALGEYIAAPT